MLIEMGGSGRDSGSREGWRNAILPGIRMGDLGGIGGGVVLLRERAGLTQAELARRSGLATSVLNRLETGKGAPSIRTIETLLRTMGMDLHDLADATLEFAGAEAAFSKLVAEKKWEKTGQ